MSDAIGKCNRLVQNAGATEATLYIYDTIGADVIGLQGAKSFSEAMSELKSVSDVHVRINSNGGSAFHALGMYNTLKDHPATIHVHVDGIALSAASIVAMAGDTIEMAENALMMIHPASSDAGGTAEEHRNHADMLDQLNLSVVKTYSDRTKIPPEEITSMLKATTWMRAEEAKAKGFATKISPNKAVSAHCDLTPFQNVPDWARDVVMQMKEEPMSTQQTATPPAPPANVTMSKEDLTALIGKAVTDAVTNAVPAAVDAANSRYRDITSLCRQAGEPQMADAFLDDPKVKVSDVQAELFKHLCKKNKPAGDGGDEPQNNGGGGGGGGDPESKWKREYKANEAYMQSQGITEAEYIATCKKKPEQS